MSTAHVQNSPPSLVCEKFSQTPVALCCFHEDILFSCATVEIVSKIKFAIYIFKGGIMGKFSCLISLCTRATILQAE